MTIQTQVTNTVTNPPGGKERGEKNKSTLEWDVIGLTSVTIAIIGAATLYAVGWMYESRWYSYYGIEPSQLNLAPNQVSIQSIPGLLFIFFSAAILLPVFIRLAIKRLQIYGFDWSDLRERNERIGTIVLQVSVLNFLLIFSFGCYISLTINNFIYEIYISLLSILIIFCFRGIVDFFDLVRFSLLRFWVIIFHTSLFLSSLSLLAVLGQFDAYRGHRLLSGDWQLQRTYIITNKEISAFSLRGSKCSEDKITTNNSSSIYCDLSLILRTENQLFFVDWEKDGFYTRNPTLYVVPIGGDDQQISLITQEHEE
jgi:hypothetical protein